MPITRRKRALGMILTTLTLSLGPIATPAWAVGPPTITFAGVWVSNWNDQGQRLYAEVDLDIAMPGGTIPQSIAGVTVTDPLGRTFPLPFSPGDLSWDTAYWADLTEQIPAPFPLGTYRFTVTDISGNVVTATDDLTANTGLPSPVVTNLLNKQILTTQTPDVCWDPVPGAAIYRVRIRSGWGDRDLFTAIRTTAGCVTVSGGVMIRGRRYQVRVEADDTTAFLPTSNFRSRRAVDVFLQGPEVGIGLSTSSPRAGTWLTIRAYVYNFFGPSTVRVTGWIGLPGSPTPVSILDVPRITFPTGTNLSVPIFSYMFTGLEPPGLYVVGLRFTDAATSQEVAVGTRTFFFTP